MVLVMEPKADAAKLKLIAELSDTISEVALSRRESMTRQILVKIKTEWRKLPEELRPWGFWVCEYAAISANSDSVDYLLVPERVWFSDRSGLRGENVWSWMRFVAAKCLAPDNNPTRLFPIGQTAFAPYEGSDDYYVEVLWGGLWGKAWRVSIGSDGRTLIRKELWRA